jgi:hypothetical protein
VGISHLVQNASGRYDASVADGVGTLEGRLFGFFRRCPLSYAATVGFSQGQQVVRDTYALLNSRQRDRIVFMAGFGDPLFNYDTPGTNRPADGSNDTGQDGIYYAARRALHRPVPDMVQPTRRAKILQDWCLRLDPVCHYSPLNLALHKAVHTSYTETNWIWRAAVLAEQSVPRP